MDSKKNWARGRSGYESVRRKSTGRTMSFDLVFGGRMRHPDWNQERAHLRALADASATWWVELLEPLDLDLETVQMYI